MTEKKIKKKGDELKCIKKHSGGKPEHIPTDISRATVKSFIAYGIPQEEILRCLDIASLNTLYKHYRRELETGRAELVASCAKSLARIALDPSHPKAATAAMFILKCRGGWRETNNLEITGKDGSAIQITPAVDLRKLSESELEQYRGIVEKATQRIEAGNDGNIIDVEAVEK